MAASENMSAGQFYGGIEDVVPRAGGDTQDRRWERLMAYDRARLGADAGVGPRTRVDRLARMNDALVGKKGWERELPMAKPDYTAHRERFIHGAPERDKVSGPGRAGVDDAEAVARVRRAEPVRKSWERPQDNKQLKMFMTPAEIHAEYAPLEGDRKYTFDGPIALENNKQLYARKLAESKLSRTEYGKIHNRQIRPAFTALEETPDAAQFSGDNSAQQRGKAFEAKLAAADAKSADWNRSLYSRIEEEGVQSPLRLGLKGGDTSEDSPAVVGGHHRLAAATDIDRKRQRNARDRARRAGTEAAPVETYIPVLHDKSIGTAKRDLYYPYD